MFHPRSIHLLCHLDSPSAANLPCLGLQQQTGPEVSELCGSYRVPSRSSLLPLRTLSPGENRSQANNLFFQPQSPLSPGESVVQLANKPPRSPALRGHTTNGENGHGFPTGSTMADGLMDMASDKAPRIGSTLRQRMFRLFRINTQAIPEINTDYFFFFFFRFQNCTQSFCRGRMGCTVRKIG
jgi:hypothetical protein